MWNTKNVYRLFVHKNVFTAAQDQAIKTSHLSFEMFHVSLGVLCHHHLFQRKKRSVSIKRKRSRKSLSKVKAKPLNVLALKKPPAKRFAPKKKRPIPGYQATAPARPRGDFRVKL